jgi:AraC family transcriptional regulator of adaptative response/methylated-DNA-[protein]-cysteine methyltransferase
MLALQWPKANIEQSQVDTQSWAEKVFARSEKNATPAKVKLWIDGSSFQLKVWQALLRIPSGALCSYSSIAQLIGQPTAARAVGSAISKNTIAYLIPCHRVIQSKGGAGQYRWGHARKQAMIAREAFLLNQFDE